MTTADVNNNLVGRRARGIFQISKRKSVEVTGTVVAIIESESSKGLWIALDKEVVSGGCTVYEYGSMASKDDNSGNLEYTELI